MKFGHLVATHSYGAKCWGVLLFVAFTSVLGFGEAGFQFDAMIVVGVVAYIDILAILVVSRHAAVDVPSIVQAWRNRRSAKC